MTHKTLLLLLALFLSSASLFSQITISGHLKNEHNDPMAFASITLTDLENNATEQATSGFEGEFLIDSLLAGQYKLEFDYAGYQTVSFTFELKADTVISHTFDAPPYEMFDEIHIVDYIVPLIYSDHPSETIVPKVAKDCDLDTVRRKGLLKSPEVYQYLVDYLHFPKYSLAEQEQGKVYAQFRIDASGNIKDVRIRKGVSECLDNVLKSALNCMPPVAIWEDYYKTGYASDGQGFAPGEYILAVLFKLD